MSAEFPTSPANPVGRRLDRLPGILARVCGEIREINTVFRLLPDNGLPTLPQERDLDEFYSDNLKSHLIMFSSDGNVARRHEVLRDKGVKVFQEITVSNHELLVAPEGAKTLENLLPVLNRDPKNQKLVFNELGRTLHGLEVARFGLPTGAFILRQFALASDKESPNGTSVFFLPPYYLDETETRQSVIERLGREFVGVNMAEHDQFMAMQGVIEGWSGND